MNAMMTPSRPVESRRRKQTPSPASDGERLLNHARLLLLAANRPVVEADVFDTASSAPRSARESYPGSCACRACVARTIEAEIRARDESAYRQFLALVDFFFEEVPGWGRDRRARAEAEMSRLLGLGGR